MYGMSLLMGRFIDNIITLFFHQSLTTPKLIQILSFLRMINFSHFVENEMISDFLFRVTNIGDIGCEQYW